MTFTSAYPITVDGTRLDTLAYNITEVGFRGVPGVRSADQPVPGRHGVIGALNEDYEAAERWLKMLVRGYDVDGLNPSRAKLDDNLDTLFRMFSVRHRLLDVRQTMGDASVRQTNCKVISALAPTIDGIGYTGELLVAFLVPDVFDQDVSTQDWSQASAVSGTEYTVTTMNGSTAPIEDAIIMVEGPITNPVLTDVETGATFTFGYSPPAGERVRVDCSTWGVTRGTNANTSLATAGPTNIVASATYSGSGSRFLRLQPNASEQAKLTLTGTGLTAATTLSVRARRKFL